MFTGIIVVGWIHPKNKRGIELLADWWKISVTFLTSNASVNEINNAQGNFLILTDEWKQPYSYKKQFIISGPHIPLHKFQNQNVQTNFNTLSEWVQTYIQKAYDVKCFFCILPFPVDMEAFQPIEKTNVHEQRTKTFMYIKNRSPDFVAKIKSIISCDFEIVYGNYNEQDYKNILLQSKFGIWVGRHESQGFAVQECLSCNVPLLILDVISQKEEVHNQISTDDTDCGVTVVPYWSEKCGWKVRIEENNLDSLFTYIKGFTDDLHTFEPRQYIQNQLSAMACAKRFEHVMYYYAPILAIFTNINTMNDRVKIVLHNMPYAKIVHASYDTSVLQPWCITYSVKKPASQFALFDEIYAAYECIRDCHKFSYFHAIHIVGQSTIEGDIHDYIQESSLLKQTHYKVWYRQKNSYLQLMSELLIDVFDLQWYEFQSQFNKLL